jgi:hypothetical protein
VVELRLPGTNQLIALSDQEALLLSGAGGFPARISRDGGETWEVIALPPLPDEDPAFRGFTGLQYLPDGSLVTQGRQGSQWLKIPPGGDSWCPLETVRLPSLPLSMHIAGGNVLWFSIDTQTPASLPLAGLACGE